MAENIALLRIVSYFSYSSNHKYFQSNVQRTQIIDKKWMPSSSFLFRYFFLNIYIYIFHPRIYHALRTRTLWRNFSTLKLNLQRKISISSHCLEHALSFTPRSFVNRKKSNLSPTVSYLFFLCNWSRLRRRAIVLVSPPLVKKNLSTRDRIQDRHVLVSKVKFSFFWDREIRSDKKFVEGRCYAPFFFFFSSSHHKCPFYMSLKC